MTWDEAGIRGLLVVLVALGAVRKAGRLRIRKKEIKEYFSTHHFNLSVLLQTRGVTATDGNGLNNLLSKCEQNKTKLVLRLPG